MAPEQARIENRIIEERLMSIGEENIQLMDSRLRSLLGQNYILHKLKALAQNASLVNNIRIPRCARRKSKFLKAWLYENWEVIGDTFIAKAMMLMNN